MNLDTIKNNIRPSDEEKDNAIEIYKKIYSYIKSDYGKESILVGSVAKDTFLKNDKDLDIFIFFPPNTPIRILVKEGIEIGKSVFRHLGIQYKISYAEHPYVSGIVDKFSVELVPCYNVQTAPEIISAVDRTPFHLEYVLANLKPEQRDEVRLLKRFLKAQKIYGADSRTNGFSGYLCELLIIHYRTFINLVANATKWKIGTQINFIDPVKEFSDPLIVVDPVDPKRNVASAVSLNSFSLFMDACHTYEETKDNTMFIGPKKGYDSVDSGLLILIDLYTDVHESTFYAQARRFVESTVQECEHYGFSIYKHGVYERGVAIDVEIKSLPEFKKHVGPPIDNYDNVSKFKHVNPKTYVEKGKLYSFRKRKYCDVNDLIEDIIKNGRGMGTYLKKAEKKIYKGHLAIEHIKEKIVYY